MGCRTVVLLINDQASGVGGWENDPDLGRKIAAGANDANDTSFGSAANLGYGRVVECEHADTQTLAVIDGYRMVPLLHDSWNRSTRNGDVPLKLLEQLADAMGYRLVRKTTR